MSDGGSIALSVLTQLISVGLARCEPLNCSQFEACYKRELVLFSVPAEDRQTLLRMVCEAKKEEEGGAYSSTTPGPKFGNTLQALNALRAPSGVPSLPLA